MVYRITSTQLSARHENYTESNFLTDVKDKCTEIVEQVLGLEQSREENYCIQELFHTFQSLQRKSISLFRVCCVTITFVVLIGLLAHVSLSIADPLKFLPHLNLGTATFIIYQNWPKKYQQQCLYLNQS